MPWVFGLEPLPIHPTKRRKLSHFSQTMARSEEQGGKDIHGTRMPRGEQLGECSVPEDPEPFVINENSEIRTSDREELIQCIKRGQRPTWVPKPGLEALCAQVNVDRPRIAAVSQQHDSQHQIIPPYSLAGYQDTSLPRPTSPLSATDALRRSLSSLHTGDFQNGYQISPGSTTTQPSLSNSPASSMHDPSSQPASSSPAYKSPESQLPARPRAPSLGSSLSSTFVMRVPTSPLINSMNNPSLDFSPRDTMAASGRSTRRKTMPPNAFGPLRMSSLDDAVPNFGRHFSAEHHPEAASAQPLHTPRRSLTSFTYQPVSNSQTHSIARSRRQSLACDVSPRQRASMVGSFEESILRGRMSIPPSKPLDFVAQIGVVGKGNCPASLKCPAHVTIPFPAVFYNYPASNDSRSISDDSPSPYVGAIDLEHNLQPAEPPIRRSARNSVALDTESLAAEMTRPENTHIGRALARESRSYKESIPPPVKVPHGGVYRVPQVGQLQIIIKNPNKTAVKLFLVPYDLKGMLPGTKTFVRQRSFSSAQNLDAVSPDRRSILTTRDRVGSKELLRYLVHIKFCCTSKGRFYLHDNIRVIFANRVPDDKERLRHEVQLPEPRFSPYKPPSDSGSRSPSINDNSFPQSQTILSPSYDNLEDILGAKHTGSNTQHPATLTFNSQTIAETPSPPQDILMDVQPEKQKQIASDDLQQTTSPTPGFLPSRSSRNSPVSWTTATKNAISVEAGDGLISRKLRELNGNLASSD